MDGLLTLYDFQVCRRHDEDNATLISFPPVGVGAIDNGQLVAIHEGKFVSIAAFISVQSLRFNYGESVIG